MKPETITNEKIHYTPPKNDTKGITIASSILLLFILCWHHALFRIDFNTASWLNIVTTFIAFEFLYTGLFITCHDAMHGVISPRVSSYFFLFPIAKKNISDVTFLS